MGSKIILSEHSGSAGARRIVFVAALLASCAPSALHAESNAELANEIQALRAQLREMKAAIAVTRGESRKTAAKVKAVASRSPAPVYAPPPPTMAIPEGATPAFITADKGLKFGAITITPGGFISGDSIFRTRTTQSDMNTDYRSIPFGNSPLAHVNEFRFSSRQSRIALLAEGRITPTMVAAGYLETDFLGATNGSNANESNSYVPRIRVLYATLDATDYGLHVLAGQNWSLATLNSKGITPRNEVTPPSIDSSYVPGFVWARQPGIRLTKDFNQKLWLSLAAEEPQTTFATACPSGTNAASTFGLTGPYGTTQNFNTVTGITCSAAGTGGGFAGSTNNFSLNHVPDIIGKAAYEVRAGERDIHLETFGIYRNYYDRVAYTNFSGFGQNTNYNSTGYGIGAGIIVPVIPRKLDFQASGLYGRGIGRYGTSQLPDVTTNIDGSLRPIQEGMLLGGVVYHATPAIDLYLFSGIEREFRTFGNNSNNLSFYGVGAPGANAATAAGCGLEPNTAADLTATGGPAPNCTSTTTGNTKQIFQITGGMWDKLYKGSFGEVRVGVQYSFTERQIYNVAGGFPYTSTLTAAQQAATNYANNFQPKAYDHIVFTSLRYYPFN